VPADVPTRPRIRLDCLGSSFAFSAGRYWNGWLLNGRILLDCPAQTVAHLYRLGRTPAGVDLVLLSHEHSDHVGGVDLFLLDLVYRYPDRRTAPTAIAGPTGIRARIDAIVGDHAHAPARQASRLSWFEDDGGATFDWAGVRVETARMAHSVADNGFRVHVDGAVVAYTGDTAPGPHIEALARGADVLIVEAGGPWPGIHCSWDDVVALRRALPPATEMIVTHYDATAVPELPPLEGFRLAEDFAVYEF
jgi:ribonuclease BN (tRNA processing enzyme)